MTLRFMKCLNVKYYATFKKFCHQWFFFSEADFKYLIKYLKKSNRGAW